MNFCPKCGVNELTELSCTNEGDRTHTRYRCDGCRTVWEETTTYNPHGDDSVAISSVDDEDTDEEEGGREESDEEDGD